MGVTRTDFGLEIPMPSKNPSITVGYARTERMALVTVVFERIPHAEREKRQVAHIEASADHVYTEEMAVEALARPPSEFGLDEPMLPLTVVRECKWIESGRDVKGRTATQPDLHA